MPYCFWTWLFENWGHRGHDIVIFRRIWASPDHKSKTHMRIGSKLCHSISLLSFWCPIVFEHDWLKIEVTGVRTSLFFVEFGRFRFISPGGRKKYQIWASQLSNPSQVWPCFNMISWVLEKLSLNYFSDNDKKKMKTYFKPWYFNWLKKKVSEYAILCEMEAPCVNTIS